MKVLVTGGRGFIGSYVCLQLESDGHNVVSFDLPKNDIRNKDSLFGAVSKVDGVIHLAGVLGTQECINNPYPCIETNIVGSINLLEALDHHKVPASFIGVGNYWMNNTYSITRNTSDRFASMYVRDRGVKVNVVRAVNAYGPGQVPAEPYGKAKVRKVLPSFICRALANHPIEIYGDGEQFSDMIYVGDVAKAMLSSLMKASSGDVFDQVIDIGPVHHTSVKSIAQRVKAVIGSESEIVHLPMRPGERPEDVIANPLAMGLIDMDPDDLLPFSEGLEKTIAYYRA